MSPEPVRPRDAASLLVLRDGAAAPEIFMVRRPAASRFMPNALVFVGGCVEESDGAPQTLACCAGLEPGEAARRLGLEPDTTRAMALHVAAVRECFEESGLLLAARSDGRGPLEDEGRAELRTLLLEGRLGLAELCRRRGLRLALEELRLLDHWVTPRFEPRRFDARFFVCRAPERQRASFDPREATSGDWLTAEQALRENREGRELLAPPTLTILERLRSRPSVAEVLAACGGPVAPTEPLLLSGTARPTLLLPGDHRYHDLASRGGPEHYVSRGEDGHWRRVCTLPGQR